MDSNTHSTAPDEASGDTTDNETETETETEMIGATGDSGAGTTEKDPEDWVTGDEPMTGAQRSYLDTLAREAG